MNVLAINAGSSSLKFELIVVEPDASGRRAERRLAGGVIERIGGRPSMNVYTENAQSHDRRVEAADHGQAVRALLAWLESPDARGPHPIDAVGHRVVHGGERFREPAEIDDSVVAALEALTVLAPLHNEPSLAAIRACRSVLGDRVPMVATFDTLFHTTLPPQAAQYAIPADLAARHAVRRYGFHGLAHRYMVERYAALESVPPSQVRLITLQLGSGCSAAAVRDGRSVDTSMGMTPLEGLMMGTRSGDLDPSLAGFLARAEGVGVGEVETWLNTRSGLLGVSGRSADMREVLEAEQQGDGRAALAVEMFCYRVRRYVGAYLAVLGGADAVVFGGGVGEHATGVRARICAGMDWCGLVLDEQRNDAAVGTEARISAPESRIQAYVIPVDEAIMIARDTVTRVAGAGRPAGATAVERPATPAAQEEPHVTR